MRGMKPSMKIWLIIIAPALLACLAWLVWLGSRPDEPVAESVSDTSQSPSFEVRVVMPRGGLPLGGILPDWFVKKLDGTPRELRFDHTSPGAKIASLRHDRLGRRPHHCELFLAAHGHGRGGPRRLLVVPPGPC